MGVVAQLHAVMGKEPQLKTSKPPNSKTSKPQDLKSSKLSKPQNHICLPIFRRNRELGSPLPFESAQPQSDLCNTGRRSNYINCEANAVPGNVIGGTRETCSKNKKFWYQCHGCGSGDPRHEHHSRAGLNVHHCLRDGSKKKGVHYFCYVENRRRQDESASTNPGILAHWD